MAGPLPATPAFSGSTSSPQANLGAGGAAIGAGATAVPATAHGVVVETAIELIGVGLMAIFAGINQGIGKLMVTLMFGFFIIWFLINVAEFSSIVKKV